MKNKRLWLVMLVMVLAFGMTVMGCGDDESESEPEQGPSKLEGPLYGLKFNGVEELTSYDSSNLDPTAYDFGCFAGAEYTSLQGSIDYYAIKVDSVWYKRLKTTSSNEIYWYFGLNGKKMEKWEDVKTTQGNATTWTPTLREEKSFEYVNNEQRDEVKIDGQVYKYKLESSKSNNYNYTFTLEYTDGSTETYRSSGTIRFQILKIYFDGPSNAPTLYLYSKDENKKKKKIS
jgi:hypothetical protein